MRSMAASEQNFLWKWIGYWSRLNVNMLYYRNMDSHAKDKTFASMGILIPGKDDLCIEATI